MSTPGIVMWTNEVFHPRARFFKEGFRHCMLFVYTAEGWYGREWRTGHGEVISPRVAEADDDLLWMLQGHNPRLAREFEKRCTKVVQVEIKHLDQWRWVHHRKRAVFYVKHHIGLRAPHIVKPYGLFLHLSPDEKSPKPFKWWNIVTPFTPVRSTRTVKLPG